jgi:hypothetical protein
VTPVIYLYLERFQEQVLDRIPFFRSGRAGGGGVPAGAGGGLPAVAREALPAVAGGAGFTAFPGAALENKP